MPKTGKQGVKTSNAFDLSMKFMLFNPRSLNNKIMLLMNAILDHSVDIAAICETWLTDVNNPITATIKSMGFSIIHNYRKDRRGGGTAVIFRSSCKLSVENISLSFQSFELTTAIIKTASAKILIVVMYRTGPLLAKFNQELDLLLAEITGKFDHIILGGDLNIHFDQHSTNKVTEHTLDTLASFGFHKIVSEPTHIGGGSLDQIFIYSLTSELTASNINVDKDNNLGSDHFPVYCEFNITLCKKYFKTIQYRKIKEIDADTFSTQLASAADAIYDLEGSFGDLLSELSSSTLSMLEDHAPILEKRVAVVDKAPWFDKEYRELRKVRRRAERSYKSEKDPLLKIKLKAAHKKLCQEASSLALDKKKEYLGHLIQNSGGNPRTLYAVVNKQLDRKQENPLPNFTDNMAELATSFNEFFVNKIDAIRQNIELSCPADLTDEFNCNNCLSEFEPTNIEEITEIIDDCGVKCAPADLLPTGLYKDNLGLLLPLIVKLVNLSLSTGNVDGVKLADIVPLLKDGSLDPNILKNYRPVSNLTFIGKLIERVVLRRLNEHLTRNDLHCPDQFAYKKNHSTETLLIKIVNDLLIATDEKSATVVMLLDLSAAFDTVDHNLLLNILEREIGLRGTVLAWFRSFLTGRTQRIRLGKITSDTIVIKFGVPQGSVLGPVLFNLYIRSIYGSVKKLGFKIFGYADDHQIIKSFRSTEQSTVLSTQLENCFDVIKRWMSKFFLQLNDAKTQIIVVGSNKVLNSIHIKGVNLGSGTTIRFISAVKNLGIHMDDKLTFEKQILELKKKCFRTIRNIRKIKFILTTEQTKVIVNSLVVSCLDYCNSLFFGASEKILHQLQLIQNAAAKAVTGKYKHDHMEDDLRKLHWLDVKKRIVFKLALLAHKAVIGLAPEYLQNMFLYSHHGHSLKLIVPYASSHAGRKSFSIVGPKIYNNLPVSVKMCVSLDMFKVCLKTYLFNLSHYDLEKLYI